MATWKKVLTSGDDSTHKNENITLAQLDTGLDSESGYGANKILKVNGAGNAIEWADDSGGIALTDLSVGSEGSASGDGAIAYDNTSGVFTYTPPDYDKYVYWEFGADSTSGSLTTDATRAQAGETVTFAGGTSISTVRTSATVTINNDAPCNVANVQSSLAALTGDDTLNIGDAGNDATVNIRGNLTVTGTTTTINTTDLAVADNSIILNSDLTGTTMPATSGVAIERGDFPNVSLHFADGNNNWVATLPNHSTDASADGVVSGVVGIIQSGTASSGNTNRQTVGDMYIKTDDEELYIYM